MTKLSIKEYKKQWYQKNKDRIKEQKKEYAKRWYQLNKEKILEKDKLKYLNNKEIIDKKNRDKYWENHNKSLEKGRRMYHKHKERYLEYQRRYRNKKWQEDSSYRLKTLLRNRINTAVRDVAKSDKTLNLLGVKDFENVKKYLSKQFQKGMSWDNYGEWHIDHIVPCASFDLTKESEQKKCFHYTNLQPLWAKDNLSKGCRLDWKGGK